MFYDPNSLRIITNQLSFLTNLEFNEEDEQDGYKAQKQDVSGRSGLPGDQMHRPRVSVISAGAGACLPVFFGISSHDILFSERYL